MYEYVYNFGFQLDFQLVCTDSDFCKRGPVLVLQVSTEDSWGRYTVEGYTFYELPKTPGHYKEVCESWRPYESLGSQVLSFFVGGAVKAREIAEIAANSIRMGEGHETVLNRYTLKTTSSGKITLEMNVCQQTQ